MSEDFLNQTLFDNPVSSYCWFLGILIAGILFKKFISVRLSRFLYTFFKKHSEGVTGESFVQLLSKPIKLFVLIIAGYLACDRLVFPDSWNLAAVHEFGIRMVIFKSFYTLIIISITWMVLRATDFLGLVLQKKAAKTISKNDDQLVEYIKEGAKILIGIFSFFIILGSVFNLNITSLIAGLGIGGLAVALAAKETIENLIGSFTIFLDQPFVLGDLVRVGNVTGTIEKIGFRSTGIRTPERSYVTVPNKKMVDAETENLSRREKRRARFILNLSYSASQDQIHHVLKDIRALLDGESIVSKPDTLIAFGNFGLHAIEIEVEFYILTDSHRNFIESKEQMNFHIMEIVHRNGCSFVNPVSLNISK